MNQFEFDQLLEKYLNGECTPEEIAFVEQWSENMLSMATSPLSVSEQQQMETQLWEKIQQTVGIKPFRWKPWALAASIVLLIGLGIKWYTWQDSPEHLIRESIASSNWGVIDLTNHSNKVQKLTLEDGSEVQLNPNSTISYPEHFGQKTRTVYLKGEAFFSIKRNPAKPFVVHTGELVTEVLGTSFTIKSYENAKAIEVLVRTGKVSVYERTKAENTRKNGVILTPNQKVIFEKESKKIIPSLVEEPVVIVPPVQPTQLIFEDAQLSQVLQRLKESYMIDFEIESDAFEHCVFTGDINDLPLHTQLNLVCKAVNASYEQRGTVIFLYGSGCK